MQYILIDYENLQPESAQFTAIDESQCQIWLFLGKNQKALPVEFCEILCRFGENVRFIRIAKIGKNALNFYLTYYLGQIIAQDKDALIFIFSRDTGFDVLVEHMESERHCRGIVRIASLVDITDFIHSPEEALAAYRENNKSEERPGACAPQDNPHFVHALYKRSLQYLIQPNIFRPRSRDNLANLLYKVLDELLYLYEREDAMAAVSKAIDRLIAKGFISWGENYLLQYHVSGKEIMQKLVMRVYAEKVKTRKELEKSVRAKAESVGLNVDEHSVENFIAYCEKKGILRLENDEVKYTLPLLLKDQMAVQEQERMEITRHANTFFSKFPTNKPGTHAKLMTALQHSLKLGHNQTKQLIDYLIAKERMQMGAKGNIIWQ